MRISADDVRNLIRYMAVAIEMARERLMDEAPDAQCWRISELVENAIISESQTGGLPLSLVKLKEAVAMCDVYEPEIPLYKGEKP
jgi:hypothetical protein